MKSLSLLFVSLCFFVKGFSQQFPSDTSSRPLVLVDTFTTDTRCLILGADKIASVNVYKDSSAIKMFGEKGRNGVVVIHPKENVKLLRLSEILNTFNFPDSERHLRVCIDDVIVSRADLILADMREIESVGTFNVVDWNCLTAPKEEKLINITRRKSKE